MSSKKSAWQMSIEKSAATSGQFETVDKSGKSVILTWHKTGVTDSEYAQIMRSVADVAVQAYLSVEMQFLKSYPDVLVADEHYKHFAAFSDHDSHEIDWKAVEGKVADWLRSLYVTELPEAAVKFFANDIFVVAKVIDAATNKLLGFTLFVIAPCHPQGSVWCGHLAVSPDAQGRGLGKILMSSILKIVPAVNRILINTRVTNETAFKAYTAWGFEQDPQPVENPNMKFNKEHWVPYMDYKTERSDVLQKVANKFIEIG